MHRSRERTSDGNWPDFDRTKSGQIILPVYRSKPIWSVKDYLVKSGEIAFSEDDDEWNCLFTAMFCLGLHNLFNYTYKYGSRTWIFPNACLDSQTVSHSKPKKVVPWWMTFFLTPYNDVLLYLRSFLALLLKNYICLCLSGQTFLPDNCLVNRWSRQISQFPSLV